MIDAIEIGYAIKDRRAQLGLTQAQLAKAAGVSKRCLWSLELGVNPGVQLDKLTAVLAALGLDLVILTTDAPRTEAEPDKASPAQQIASDTIVNGMTDEGGSGIDALAILTGGK